jgi:hypothetical protein
MSLASLRLTLVLLLALLAAGGLWYWSGIMRGPDRQTMGLGPGEHSVAVDPAKRSASIPRPDEPAIRTTSNSTEDTHGPRSVRSGEELLRELMSGRLRIEDFTEKEHARLLRHRVMIQCTRLTPSDVDSQIARLSALPSLERTVDALGVDLSEPQLQNLNLMAESHAARLRELSECILADVEVGLATMWNDGRIRLVKRSAAPPADEASHEPGAFVLKRSVAVGGVAGTYIVSYSSSDFPVTQLRMDELNDLKEWVRSQQVEYLRSLK